jgi:hypothetical protein
MQVFLRHRNWNTNISGAETIACVIKREDFLKLTGPALREALPKRWR